MPELPEVETVRLGLDPHLVGRRIERITPSDFPGVMGGMQIELASVMLANRPFTGTRRRGKYLLFDLDEMESLVVHLRMTGVLTLQQRDDPLERFQRLSIELDNGTDLRFSDQRKFGRVTIASSDDVDALMLKLGPEPLSPEFDGSVVQALVARRSAPIKAVLLDQHAIAGLGNIYVDEALFHAKIHPARTANTLTPAESNLLAEKIRHVLQVGLDHRGTSFSSFRDVYGEKGSNQDQLVVYGRGAAGLPCVRCGTPLQRITLAGRGTSFCPECQPVP
ncbi:bifunctional DNA-formamidopyrimidine glycosylase/DNA-(apurinic or apyrimidinic site) lyase [soil metagenome]